MRTAHGLLGRLGLAAGFAAVLVALFAFSTSAAVGLVVVSTDPYTNTSSYHQTEVESDTFSFGSTIVSAFQTGRFNDGGASNIGWATTTDGGATWQHGFLPRTTVYATPPGPLQRVTDPAVTYDAFHGVWMIFILGSQSGFGFFGDGVAVSRSQDGLNWSSPVLVQRATGNQNFDSTWINCDNWPSSPFYGHCYAEWDDFGNLNQLHVSTSTDGGLTWTEASVPPGSIVIHGQPVSQPNGRVIMPIGDGFLSSQLSFISTNGGQSFTGPFTISGIQAHDPAGNIRSLDVPAADGDVGGKVYTVWYDCRFRSGCATNDLVMSTSTDGQNWTSPFRIPIDPISSSVDHFLPGIVVKPGTFGNSARITVVFYYYPQANCSTSTCKLFYGGITSADGGATWSSPVTLAGPITLTWLPLTTQGYMVGDYSSASYTGNRPNSVFAVATEGTCQLGQITSCHEPMVAVDVPIGTGPTSPAGPGRSVPVRTPTGPLVSAR